MYDAGVSVIGYHILEDCQSIFSFDIVKDINQIMKLDNYHFVLLCSYMYKYKLS